MLADSHSPLALGMSVALPLRHEFRLLCRNTFIDGVVSDSDEEEIETQSCPAALACPAERPSAPSYSRKHTFTEPEWLRGICVLLSCSPLYITQTRLWSVTRKRWRRNAVGRHRCRQTSQYALRMKRTEALTKPLPEYTFAELKSFVQVACNMIPAGVLLLFVDRDCIVHVTARKLIFIDAAACNRIQLKTRHKPVALAVRSVQAKSFSLHDASLFNHRSGCWSAPSKCCACGSPMRS